MLLMDWVWDRDSGPACCMHFLHRKDSCKHLSASFPAACSEHAAHMPRVEPLLAELLMLLLGSPGPRRAFMLSKQRACYGLGGSSQWVLSEFLLKWESWGFFVLLCFILPFPLFECDPCNFVFTEILTGSIANCLHAGRSLPALSYSASRQGCGFHQEQCQESC